MHLQGIKFVRRVDVFGEKSDLGADHTVQSRAGSDRHSWTEKMDRVAYDSERSSRLNREARLKGVLEQTGIDPNDHAVHHLQSKPFNVLGDGEWCRRVKHSPPLAARAPNADSDRHSWTESVDRLSYDSGRSSRPTREARLKGGCEKMLGRSEVPLSDKDPNTMSCA